MTIRVTRLLLGFCVLVVATGVANGQTSSNLPANDSAEVVKELGMLRQSVQSLDATLSDIGNKMMPALGKGKDAVVETQGRISTAFGLMAQAEQRAETLRRQLLELIEKETLYRVRITQIEEDMRPENVERSLNPYGTTRTAEVRETRRRVLDTDRRGYQTLLALTIESRTKLEEEVKQADALVLRLRLRLYPLLEKEIDKLNPQP